jgi:hypothetical protein
LPKDKYDGGQGKKILDALEFFSKSIKKEVTLAKSDFCVCFLEAFNMMFPAQLETRCESKYEALKC